MMPSRPLRGPTPNDILRAFSHCSYAVAPNAIIDFMATIGPEVGDPFIVRTIAVAVVDISGMKPPARKVKHLDNLLDDVNFPPDVAREINRVIDLIHLPSDLRDLADRLVPPLHNLAGAVLEPPFPVSDQARDQVANSPVSQKVYDEVMASFHTRREDFVTHVGYGLLLHTVAPEPTRRKGVENSIERIPEHIALMDLAAGICGMTLHHPETWWGRKTRMELVTMYNHARARDTAVQEVVDSGETITPVRNLTAIIDDLVIDYCQRTMKADDQDLRPLPFWHQVLSNTPAPQ